MPILVRFCLLLCIRCLYLFYDLGALQPLDRKDPDGKDNDSTLDNSILDTKEKTYTTDVNGKVKKVNFWFISNLLIFFH